MQETWVQSLDREDSLEKGMETHSSIKHAHKFFDSPPFKRWSSFPSLWRWKGVGDLMINI